MLKSIDVKSASPAAQGPAKDIKRLSDVILNDFWAAAFTAGTQFHWNFDGGPGFSLGHDDAATVATDQIMRQNEILHQAWVATKDRRSYPVMARRRLVSKGVRMLESFTAFNAGDTLKIDFAAMDATQGFCADRSSAAYAVN